jgi:thiamine kinase-like enzyme
MATYYNIYPEEGELLPEIFFKAFENDTEKTCGLQQALKYLKDEHRLVHDDLHWKNILIDEQGEIYLIDFGR